MKTSPQNRAGVIWLVLVCVALANTVQLSIGYRSVGALPAQLVPAYSTGDAQVAWWIRPHVQVALVGRNLLQPHRPEYRGDPSDLVGIRRSVYVKLTWTP